ncbi:MAG: hypothetical protein WCE63_23525 [Acidobacteriaceae bacterium]
MEMTYPLLEQRRGAFRTEKLIALVIWLTLRKERDKSTRQALVNPLT